jgi:hypothetical protein
VAESASTAAIATSWPVETATGPMENARTPAPTRGTKTPRYSASPTATAAIDPVSITKQAIQP